MRNSSRIGILLLSATLLVQPFAARSVGAADAPPADTAKPKLLVLLVFDQFRPDYLQSFSSYLSAGGFKRFIQEGSEFRDSLLRYSGTFTCPGHATISTGTWPSVHGIVANRWLDSKTGKMTYCVGEPLGTAVGNLTENVKVPFLADRIIEAGGKVVALSLKDRSAVMLGGRKPTATAWFKRDTGELAAVSSSGKTPEWVSDWNGTWRRFSKWDGKKWEPLPLSSMAPEVEPNDFPIEVPEGFGTKFPHPLPDYDRKNPKPFWKAFEGTPFAGTLIEEIAETAIKSEDLGKDDKVDLLAISFSQTDIIGHTFGPDSAEIRDAVLRADQDVEKLLAYLDKNIGKGNWSMALTSDHGVATVPEIAVRHGAEGGRVDSEGFGKRFEKYLGEALAAEGVPPAKLVHGKDEEGPVGLHGLDVYLDPATVAPENRAKVRDAAARVLRAQPEVRYAYSQEELSDKQFVGPYVKSLRLSFVPERSGDVMLVWKRGWIDYRTGTDHGSPEDVYVPLLFLGNGVRKAQFKTSSTPADIAPTLLSIAGLPIPKGFSGRVLPVSPKPAAAQPAAPAEGGGDTSGDADPTPNR